MFVNKIHSNFLWEHILDIKINILKEYKIILSLNNHSLLNIKI